MAETDREATQSGDEKIFILAQDAMIHVDEMVQAWRRGEIMRFESNRIHALEALHQIRVLTERMP